MERGRRPVLVGKVIGTKMQKTIKVEVTRLVKHPKYGKYIRRRSIIKAHDENSQAKENDIVEIMSTRPISKTKSWRLVRVLQASKEEV